MRDCGKAGKVMEGKEDINNLGTEGELLEIYLTNSDLIQRQET